MTRFTGIQKVTDGALAIKKLVKKMVKLHLPSCSTVSCFPPCSVPLEANQWEWHQWVLLSPGVPVSVLLSNNQRGCCSAAKSCPILCNPTDCSMPGFPVLHYSLAFAQTHVHWVRDAIQPSHPLSPPSALVPNFSQRQDLFRWVGSSHQVCKVLELQLQHQSFQWIFRTDFL